MGAFCVCAFTNCLLFSSLFFETVELQCCEKELLVQLRFAKTICKSLEKRPILVIVQQ